LLFVSFSTGAVAVAPLDDGFLAVKTKPRKGRALGGPVPKGHLKEVLVDLLRLIGEVGHALPS